MSARSAQLMLLTIATCVASASGVRAAISGFAIEPHAGGISTLTTGEEVFTTQWFISFSDPDDRLIGIVETDVFTDAPGGWYQHPLAVSLAPPSSLLVAQTDAHFDSFVSIGAQSDDTWTMFDDDWSETVFAAGGMFGGWTNADPGNGMGDPDAEGRVFVAQLSMHSPEPTSGYFGDLVVLWTDGETPDINAAHIEVFYIIPTPPGIALVLGAPFMARWSRSRVRRGSGPVCDSDTAQGR